MQRDSTFYTLTVAVVLCLVCSVVVATAANILRPGIERNEELKRQRNVLVAAGLFDPQTDDKQTVPELYAERVGAVIVDLGDGSLKKDVDLESFLPADYAKENDAFTSTEGNLMGIEKRENATFAYLVRAEDDPERIAQIVLPVYGKGLWSTLMGYIALEQQKAEGETVGSGDFDRIAGLTFYKHAETPGLGGEIDNPRWKSSWKGKVAYDADGQPQIDIVKGGYDRDSPSADYAIDGLSGATITSNGVESLVNYWLSDAAFKPFVERVNAGEVAIPAPGEGPDPADDNGGVPADPEEMMKGEGAGIGSEQS